MANPAEARARFYAHLRQRNSGVFGTSLSQSQVNGIEGLLDAFATHGDGRAKTLAYGLATAYHETGRKMVPVREIGRGRGRKYGVPAGPYGHVYYGRGHVQLTWLDNYRRSSADAGTDLVKNPDAMLDPEISARVLWRGLLDGRWNGRGRGIAHYLPTSGSDDLRNARRTVNVTDKWEAIGSYYKSFMAAIDAAGGVSALYPAVAQPEPQPSPQKPADAPEPAPAPVQPKPAEPAPQAAAGGWLTGALTALAEIIKSWGKRS